MTSENIQFENAIRKALCDFKIKLEQQRMFQIQNSLLKNLQKEVKKHEYCESQEIKNLSIEYENFYNNLKSSGRSYENIVNEKSLVDTYSAFEKFLFDCFYSLYNSFPKFLGDKIEVNTSDLFIDENIELCKKNIIELKVKSSIQAKNIVNIMDEFFKIFKIGTKKENIATILNEEIDTLYQIALVRNLVIHNNSIVNRIYIEQIKHVAKIKYEFNNRDVVLNELENLVDDLKIISTKACEKITEIIISNSRRLIEYHRNK